MDRGKGILSRKDNCVIQIYLDDETASKRGLLKG